MNTAAACQHETYLGANTSAVSIEERDLKANTVTVVVVSSVDEMNVKANTAAASVDQMNLEVNTNKAASTERKRSRGEYGGVGHRCRRIRRDYFLIRYWSMRRWSKGIIPGV